MEYIDHTELDRYNARRDYNQHIQGIQLAKEAYDVQQQRKHLDKIEAELLNKLKIIAGDKTTEFGDYVYIRSFRAGSVNYSAIPELLNVRLEEYRKAEVVTWSLVKK